MVEELIEPQLDEMLRLKILSDLFSKWLKQQIELISGSSAIFMKN
ncbi:Parvulin-like peptidyl-prolyl isomerase [Nostoc flagelliforme CCNUN1]|uniref:Parvulin-like peptidyl-prolyl isomerase n=1 Tax=Nostoc flagelliforme CCNUN1 TaxID=2038116 RepID=A0A2K8SHU3_9NOSO|nr:Parvulin-like peptidyl-prolyl isomerase [Nostoc flagelliforme CCNUN1]